MRDDLNTLPTGLPIPEPAPNAREIARKHIAKIRHDLHFCTKHHAYMATEDVRWICVLLEQFVLEVEKQDSIILSQEVPRERR